MPHCRRAFMRQHVSQRALRRVHASWSNAAWSQIAHSPLRRFKFCAVFLPLRSVSLCSAYLSSSATMLLSLTPIVLALPILASAGAVINNPYSPPHQSENGQAGCAPLARPVLSNLTPLRQLQRLREPWRQSFLRMPNLLHPVSRRLLSVCSPKSCVLSPWSARAGS